MTEVYREKGVALDQEAIIRLRPSIEEYVKEDLGIVFDRTELFWRMNDDGQFDFTLVFHEADH